MKKLALALVLMGSPAIAQQQQQQQQKLDPATWQRIVNQIAQQRDAAMVAAAVAETKAAQLADEITKLKTEFEKKDQSR